jgi:hypothetical protein
VTSEENRLLEADFTEKEIVTSPMFKRVNCTLIIMIKYRIKSNSQIPFEFNSNSTLELYLNFISNSVAI